MKLQKLKKNRITLVIGLLILFVLLMFALFPGLFTSYDPVSRDTSSLLQAPSAEHWFGTDDFGRDVFTRAVYSARIDLSISIFAMLVPLIIGTFLGLVAGYYGKKTDMIIMRIVDIFTIFPFMIMVIVIVAIAGSGIKNVFIAIWLIGWKEYTRIIRSAVLVEKNKDYVLAAKTLGYSDFRIMFRHLLPNVISNSVIYATSDVIICMMAGASLSFLGLGVQAPTPEWGLMISDGKSYLSQAPWMALFPGLVMVIAGIGLSFVGDGISDILRGKDRQ